MPNTQDVRVTTTVRVKPTALAEIDQIAEVEQRTRADMIRVLLADGIKAYRKTHA